MKIDTSKLIEIQKLLKSDRHTGVKRTNSGKLIATDGHYAVITNYAPKINPQKFPEMLTDTQDEWIEKYFSAEHARKAERFEIPVKKLPWGKICDTCTGDGQFMHLGNMVECHRCNGYGRTQLPIITPAGYLVDERFIGEITRIFSEQQWAYQKDLSCFTASKGAYTFMVMRLLNDGEVWAK